MDFSSKSKKQLKALALVLEIEVEAKKKNKPTMDELVVALEGYEADNGDEAIQAAYEKLGITDEPEEDTESEDEDTDDEVEEVKGGKVFTYVGKGESSPQKINFMGLQEFVRGRPVTVTNPKLIAKLKGVPTFVQGKADAELLQAIEDEGMAVAEKNRRMDAQMDANFKKQHGGTAKGE